MFTNQQIIEYYNRTERDYQDYWGHHSLSLGYWDGTTKNMLDSIRRMNTVMISRAGIRREDIVLDAGCGHGRPAAQIAKEVGCRVHGITLVQRQAEISRQYAFRQNVDHLVDFQVMDYHKTTFPDKSFDIVWGLESICHAPRKELFIREAYRILKQEGRLIVSDMFKVRKNMTEKEQALFQRTFHGYFVWDLDTVEDFTRHIKEAGFRDISVTDISAEVLPGIKYLRWVTLPWMFYIPFRNCLGETYRYRINNLWASYTLKKICDLNLVTHQIIVGKK